MAGSAEAPQFPWAYKSLTRLLKGSASPAGAELTVVLRLRWAYGREMKASGAAWSGTKGFLDGFVSAKRGWGSELP